MTWAGLLQAVLAVAIGVSGIMLMVETKVWKSDVGRLLVVIVVGVTISCFPLFNCLYAIDRLIALTVATPLVVAMLNNVCKPVEVKVLSTLPPMMLELSRSAYKFSFGVMRVAVPT